MLRKSAKMIGHIISASICYFLKTLIKGYRYFISPFFPKSCRFYPTCSEYAIIALSKYKLKGIIMTIKRIIKCTAMHSGGYDPVDDNVNSRKNKIN